ncbi:GAF domain-containing protein, partial [Deinococcus pimensis]|uniref:GAF domain-containing protein n=1 Tax=Deinococcus pimensis TaxID=309888 RepID=UPI0012F98C4F
MPSPFDESARVLSEHLSGDAVLDVCAALARALTAEDVKSVVLQRIVPLTGAFAGTIVRRADADTFLVFGATGYADDAQLSWRQQPAGGRYPVTTAIDERRAVFATRAEAERDYPDMRGLLHADTRAVAAVPLVEDGEVLAALTLSFREETAVRPERRGAVTALVELASGALARARRHDAERRARERAALLAETGKVLAASLDVGETLDHLMTLAITHVADWGAVYLPDERGVPMPVAVAHQDPALVDLLRAFVAQYDPDPNTPGSTAWVMRTGQPFLLPVVPRSSIEAIEEPERRASIERMGFHSLIHVPLKVEGRVVGLLGLATSRPERTYGPDDLALAEDLAAQAALALENARQYHRTRLAEERYRSLVDATTQTVWTADPSGELHGEQPGWTRLTGQGPAEFRGQGWSERVHPDDRARSVHAWRRA